MTDTTQQRINMVDSQVRPSDVTDRRIIRAMLEVPREAFAPPALHAIAYMDEAVPVTAGRRRAGPRRCWRRARSPRCVQLAEIEPDAPCWMWAAPPATRRPCSASLPARWWRWRPMRRWPPRRRADSAPARCGQRHGARARWRPGRRRRHRSMPSCSMAPCRRCRRPARPARGWRPAGGRDRRGGFGRAQVWRRTGARRRPQRLRCGRRGAARVSRREAGFSVMS